MKESTKEKLRMSKSAFYIADPLAIKNALLLLATQTTYTMLKWK